MEQSIQTIIVNSQYNVFTKFDHVTYDLLLIKITSSTLETPVHNPQSYELRTSIGYKWSSIRPLVLVS